MACGATISVVATVFAGVGLFFAGYQLVILRKRERADRVASILGQIYNDEGMRDVFYKIEYNELQYDPEQFHGSITEQHLDHLLLLLDLLCTQADMGLTTDNDLQPVSYELLRVYTSDLVKGYLNFLDNYFLRHGIERKPFSSFQKHAAALKEK